MSYKAKQFDNLKRSAAAMANNTRAKVFKDKKDGNQDQEEETEKLISEGKAIYNEKHNTNH